MRQGKLRRKVFLDADVVNSLQVIAEFEEQTVSQVADRLLEAAIQERQDVELESWHALTFREQQTACLICLGDTNRDIGRELFISRETVKTHVEKVFNKFGVNSREDLVKMLVKSGVDLAQARQRLFAEKPADRKAEVL